jgi:predicted  nucleic acid-binding Zn-ribbon protein
MTFEDGNSANIIQKVVENRMLLAFLTEDARDFDYLSRHVREHKMPFITLLRPEKQSRYSDASRPPLTEYGYPKYCDSLFRAPPLVLQMLCRVASLDRIPVGTGRTARSSIPELSERVFPQHGITRYVVDNLYYIIYKSRGGGRPTLASSAIGPSSIWRDFASQEEDVKSIVAKRDKTQDKLQALQGQQAVLKDRVKSHKAALADATQRLQDVKDRIAKRSSIEQKLAQIKEKIRDLEKECQSTPRKQKDLKARIGELVEMKMQIEEKRVTAIKRIIPILKEMDRISREDHVMEARIAELQEKLDEERAKYANLERKILDLNNEKQAKEQTIRKCKAEAEQICPLTDENKEMMAALPSDLEVLKSDLARLRARHASLSHIDPTIAARFREAEQKRTDTQARLEELQRSIEAAEAELAKRFNAWRQMLGGEVEKINGAFQELMQTCSYRGEVKLDWDERDKIETYKLSLLVAFDRMANLNILSATRQSGGEKSVTTLLYLLALQDCTQFPFRVVDEINQGMDEVNDRNTFFQVMSYGMRRNQASQYFLVTPKLLPQLDLMEGVTVLVVMNGPYIPEELNKPITLSSSLATA